MFSVIIPTYNNINYLKICLDSLKKNSKFNHEIILHINEGVDGSLDYARNNNFLFTYSQINAGVCVAFNQAVKKATKKYMPNSWFDKLPHTHKALDDAIGQGALFCNILAELELA